MQLVTTQADSKIGGHKTLIPTCVSRVINLIQRNGAGKLSQNLRGSSACWSTAFMHTDSRPSE
jgi:hypothetical protein